jgi:uncharacterized membrane protein YeaQ/YmgE (transglycosylase-associated protein family)
MSTLIEVLILIAAMTGVGIIIAVLAGLIWKDNRPIGVTGDYIASILSAIIMGLVDWYLIPAMGFGDTIRWLGVILEPPATALIVLWVIRKAKE